MHYNVEIGPVKNTGGVITDMCFRDKDMARLAGKRTLRNIERGRNRLGTWTVTQEDISEDHTVMSFDNKPTWKLRVRECPYSSDNDVSCYVRVRLPQALKER